MSDEQNQAADPVVINALGPSDAAEQVEVTRRYENNVEAFDAKQAESLAAQSAPNPTTDAELARQAYGEDWNKRRGHKVVGATESGDPLYAHGGVVVDSAGHALGSTSDVDRAAALKESLGGGAADADRYPVTAEAVAADEADKPTPAKRSAAKSAAKD